MKVLYAGDTELIATVLLYGSEVIHTIERTHYGYTYLMKALQDSNIEVTCQTNQTAFSQFPRTTEELSHYDVVILSDLGHDTLALYPGDLLYKTNPNRIQALTDYVRGGGGLAYCGGWLSFQGYQGKGGWYGSMLEEVLPVEILPIPDDRVEHIEGIKPRITNSKHPITRDIPWDTCPVFLGYNKVGAVKKKADLLATIDKNPFMVASKAMKGRVLVMTSDPAPHWGTYFTKWEYYQRFWTQTLEWLAKAI